MGVWLHVYVCAMCVPPALRDQKRLLEPMELWVAVSFAVAAGDGTQQLVLLTAEPSLYPLAFLLILMTLGSVHFI